jgi:hypothetical protein
LYILGAWLLFSKFGVNRKLALVPWVREYQLGVCAKKETEGRVFCILSVVITALSVTGLFLTEFSELENPIIQTLIPLIAVLLASVFLMYFIYNIRIFSGLIRQLGLRVPDDLSVAGVDGTYSQRYFDDDLTTLHLNAALQGRRCVEVLLNVIEGRKFKYVTNIPVSLKRERP